MTSTFLRRWLVVSWAVLVAAALSAACATERADRERPERAAERSALVTATAYNSHPDQTDGDPFLTASGERLDPGTKALAVSPDLAAAGLDFGTRVRIDGLDGEWVVLDRMPASRRRSIDL